MPRGCQPQNPSWGGDHPRLHSLSHCWGRAPWDRRALSAPEHGPTGLLSTRDTQTLPVPSCIINYTNEALVLGTAGYAPELLGTPPFHPDQYFYLLL